MMRIVICSRLEDALSFMRKGSKGMTSGKPYLQEHLIKAVLDVSNHVLMKSTIYSNLTPMEVCPGFIRNSKYASASFIKEIFLLLAAFEVFSIPFANRMTKVF